MSRFHSDGSDSVGKEREGREEQGEGGAVAVEIPLLEIELGVEILVVDQVKKRVAEDGEVLQGLVVDAVLFEGSGG